MCSVFPLLGRSLVHLVYFATSASFPLGQGVRPWRGQRVGGAEVALLLGRLGQVVDQGEPGKYRFPHINFSFFFQKTILVVHVSRLERYPVLLRVVLDPVAPLLGQSVDDLVFNYNFHTIAT